MKKILLGLLALPIFSMASENHLNLPFYQYKLKEGKGKELVEINCQMCHSLGYVLNQGKMSKETWEHIVHHMINDFKAPIDDKTAKEIIQYLTQTYGKENSKKD